MATSNGGPSTSASAILQPVTGTFDASGTLIQMYGPGGVAINSVYNPAAVAITGGDAAVSSAGLKFTADANGNSLLGDQRPAVTGSGNTVAGSQAGSLLDNGNSNTFFGYKAGLNVKTLGGDGNLVGALNTFIGSEAGGNCTTGYANVGIGQKALISITTTSGNIGIGKSAGANHTGSRSIYIGQGAGEFAGASDDNVRIGYGSGNGNVVSQVVFVGAGSGGASTATGLVAVGYNAGASSLAGGGGDSVYVGNIAGYGITSGGSNTLIGRSAGLSLTTQNGNVCVGAYAGYQDTGSHNIVFGRQCGAGSLSNTFVAGGSVVAANAAAIRDVYIGNGPTAAVPLSTTYHGTGGNGTDIAGADIVIAGGQGTGTGASGKVAMAVAPAGSTGTTANTLTNFLELLTNGFFFVRNASTIPASNAVGGGYLYAEGGALKWRGSSGTITTIAAA